ncbi:MAG: phosphatase PAP2 family protein [Thermoplasmata archaeon]|nr:phosphatase PAP2 family protein [Thermoplasmata archaeon]
MDELDILEWLQGAAPALNDVMVAITTVSTYAAVWLILAFLLTCSKEYRRAGYAVIVSVVVAWILADFVIKPLVGRERPYEVTGFDILVSAASTSSFPSGHTAFSFAAATAVFIHNRKWGIPALVFAALVGISRMYLYMHWPTDVLAGALLGIAAAYLCVWFLSRYIPAYRDLPDPRESGGQ